MNYPNMSYEIIEAIEQAFGDNADLMIDCFLYLTALHENQDFCNQLKQIAEDRLDKINVCPKCGTVMQYSTWKEPHTELGINVYEEMSERYCPNCDLGIKE